MFRSWLQSAVIMVGGLLAFLVSTPSLAVPVVIDYELIAQAAPGHYEYRYTLTNVSLTPPLAWFSIDFDTALYDESSLRVTTAGLGDWSQQILGSVLANPAQYDSYNAGGLGLAIGSSLTGFAVEFTWLGAGKPSSQAFIVYDPGTLNVLDTGVTTSVPEPSNIVLLLVGLAGIAAIGRRRAA